MLPQMENGAMILMATFFIFTQELETYETLYFTGERVHYA